MNGIDDFLEAQYKGCGRQLNVERFLDGHLSHAQWQREVAGRVRELLGRMPHHEQPVQADFHLPEETLEFGTRGKLTIKAECCLDTPVFILRPKMEDDKTPVILCLHGHGFGHADIVGMLGEDSYQKQFAVAVCENGMIAVAPELAGFGALRLQEDILLKKAEESSCHRLSMGLLSCGRTMAGVRVHQCARVLDVIQSLFPGHPIGVMGISGGGMIAAFLTVLDQRISACVISGYACTFRDSILAVHHCVDNYLPGMLEWFEMEDVLAAIAPRPMLWETGSRDPIFPQEAVLRAGAAVRRCYERLNAAGAFQIHAFQGGHEISGEESYAFLKARCV